MPNSSVKNVKVSGIVSCVPDIVIENASNPIFENSDEAKKFIEVTGIASKRHVGENILTSDLCIFASEKLLNDLKWDKEDVDLLIFVSQTPDYLAPNTSIIIQDRLGLSKNTMCFDIPLGCSGYVYGLSVAASIMSANGFKKALLLVGDTLSLQSSPRDKSTYPLFGDAGTATALEYAADNEISFLMWSDGSGHKSIIVPDGGYRSPFTSESLVEKEDEGNFRSGINTYMNGTDVFSFGISQVPKLMKKFFEFTQTSPQQYDYAIFHQANRFMNEMIRKKIGFEKKQVPYSLTEYGNTSSATIPLTINYEYSSLQEKNPKKIIMCGFGVGLSVGIASVSLDKNFISKIVEYNE